MALPEEDTQQTPVPAITKESVEAALRTEERFQNYFEGFYPSTRDSFINTYATYKSMWWQYGPMYIEQNEREEMRWINAAAEHLEYIQHKKLFDAQCLWRAEKVSYPGVEICYDFELWSMNVMACPFIEPVTRDDVELYIQYLGQNNVELDPDWQGDNWHDYKEIKEAFATDNENQNFPEWYDFHNGRTGAGVYLSLPDIRGEKESFYEDLVRAERSEENKAQHEEWERTRDKRPFLMFYDENQLEFFIKTFEDSQTLEYYRAYKQRFRNQDEEEDLRATISLLLNAGEPVPIESHYDFREALERAAEKFRAKKIAEFLPFAFEEYSLNRSMGLSTGKDEHERRFKSYQELRQMWYDRIIKGRIINGEPGDMNF